MNATEAGVKRVGGRPRGFDREAALDTAMQLFWRHGYEGVSISDLTDAIGIAPPSLYAAFGSKAGLYREALDRYAEGPGALDMSLPRTADSLVEAVDGLLSAAIASVSASGRACMITSGMLACHPDHEGLARELAARRKALQAALEEQLSPWVEPTSASVLARYLMVVIQGLSAQARDGVTAKELESVLPLIRAALAASRFGSGRHHHLRA